MVVTRKQGDKGQQHSRKDRDPALPVQHPHANQLALGTSLMAQTSLPHPWNHGMAKSRSGPLRNPDALLEPMPAAELASWDDASLLRELP